MDYIIDKLSYENHNFVLFDIDRLINVYKNLMIL